MLYKTHGCGLEGVEGRIVDCEADVGEGLPGIVLVGYLTSAVRESQERVRTAIKNSGFRLPPKKVTVNLSPADMRKDGTSYDLPIAVSLLGAYGLINDEYAKDSLFAGELSLSGSILPVHGTLSLVSAAKQHGLKRCFLPAANASEGSVIEGIESIGTESLSELVDILRSKKPVPKPAVYNDNFDFIYSGPDFSEISGQKMVKRATILAVAGRHNILYIGPPGTGKSMIASRIPGIMPCMTRAERLEVSKLYSICGLLPENEPLIRNRPFRSPHHTISPQALAGGGLHPKPGEISLASGGVLFLDELAEFKRESLEILRQPLEERKLLISRLYGSYTYPANFSLVCAMNPCRCGYYPDKTKCNCNDTQVRAYIGKISRPLLDRIDICVETKPVSYDDLDRKGSSEKSADIRKKIEEVRAIQQERLSPYGILYNSEMSRQMIEEFCPISKNDNDFLKKYYEMKGLSARGLNRILRVARTAADYDKSRNITHEHLCEAISYRSVEDKFWGGKMHERIRPFG